MLHRNQVAWIAVGLTLFLSACSTRTATPAPTPIATPTPVSTSTPPNEVFLSEIVKTPQPTPWATSLPNHLGITPGLTTEAEVRARFGEPEELGCIINNQLLWDTACQVPGDIRKILTYVKQNLYLQVEGGRVVSVEFNLGVGNVPVSIVETIIDKHGKPDLLKFIIPRHQYPPAFPYGYLVYASKGVMFGFDCHAAPGGLCKGAPRDGRVIGETHFVPLSVTEWFEQVKTKPATYPDMGLEFYIRPWTGFSN